MYTVEMIWKETCSNNDQRGDFQLQGRITSWENVDSAGEPNISAYLEAEPVYSGWLARRFPVRLVQARAKPE